MMTDKDNATLKPMTPGEFSKLSFGAYIAFISFIEHNKTIDETIAAMSPIMAAYGYALTVENFARNIIPYMAYYDEVEQEIKVKSVSKLRHFIKRGCECKGVIHLTLKDFLVRRSIFKCAHDGHIVKDVEAQLSILDDSHNKCTALISAGYCEQCKVYFILESTFEAIKSKGVPFCRVVDEKTYAKNNSNNAMQLAQESILMQYGYNVSQQDEVTQERRHSILAMLIDNNIMSKSQIISYLDFFIRQRQSQDKYLVAISKWEEDKEFIKKYRLGQYISVGVGTIYRL